MTSIYRWEHYFKRYGSHKKSLIFEMKLVENGIKDKMDNMQTMGKSWNEVR